MQLGSRAALFQAVRDEYRLPESRVLLRRAQSNASTSLYSVASNSPTQSFRSPVNSLTTPTRSGVSRRTSSAILIPPVVRVADPEAGEEMPPPPYASQDPEPDSTRMLQIRLAAEAEAAGRLGMEGTSAAGSRTETSSSTQESQAITPTVHHSPAARQSSTPTSPPTDPEEARIWEESQLDEAKRASIAAERERLELEEAMRLSLQESEREAALPPVFEEAESGPSSRRVSSYGPSSGTDGYHHRRAVSDAQDNGRPVASLLDNDDGYLGPMLKPQRTGAVFQSRNPFLSPQEHEASVGGNAQHDPHDLTSPIGTPPNFLSPSAGQSTPPSRRPLPRPNKSSQAPALPQRAISAAFFPRQTQSEAMTSQTSLIPAAVPATPTPLQVRDLAILSESLRCHSLTQSMTLLQLLASGISSDKL
jgi:hypothetical protein